MKYAQFVIGPAGSGKSTYCNVIQQYCQSQNRTVHVVNLDPAAEKFNYQASADIRDLIKVDDVQEDRQLALGPNGGLVFCMEYLLRNLKWLRDELHEQDDDYFLFDCPVFLLDTHFVLDCDQFVAGALTTLSTMVSLEVPAVNVLSKIDLLSERNKELLETFLEADASSLLQAEKTTPWNEKYRKLSEVIATVLDDYSLRGTRRNKAGDLTDCLAVHRPAQVRFVPLNTEDDESIGDLMLLIDNTIQYGEDLDVKANYPEEIDAEDSKY